MLAAADAPRAARSASSKSDHGSPKRNPSPDTSTGWIMPSNDTKSHSLPRRTAFSVTGSCLRVEEARAARDGRSWPDVVERDQQRLAVRAQHEEAPRSGGVDQAAARRRHLGDEACARSRRRSRATSSGVRLKTAMKRPSSESALDALPGKYSARFGGMTDLVQRLQRAPVVDGDDVGALAAHAAREVALGQVDLAAIGGEQRRDDEADARRCPR